MEVIRKDDVKPIISSCGPLRELYSSENIDISHVVIDKPTKKHMHKKMEEVYYIVKGKGILVLGEKEFEVNETDLIPIPKNTWHYLKPKNKPLEVLTIIHPKYNPKDEIFEKE